MTPGVLSDAAEKNLEKQMGCMAGFFQLFDRNQILNGRRVYSAKRLPSSSPGTTSPSPSERSDASPTSVCSSVKEVIPTSPPPPPSSKTPQRQDNNVATEPVTPAKSTVPSCKSSPARQQTLPLPIFSAANSNTTTAAAWKLREAPRLSLDSRIFNGKPTRIFPREIRTTTPTAQPEIDANDRQRRSPSVVARLMGLENITASNGNVDAEQAPDVSGFGANKMMAPQLRRSASESRASRDLLLPPYAFHPESNTQQGRTNDTPQPPYFDPITAKFVTNNNKAMGSQKPPLPPSSTTTTPITNNNYHQSHAPPFPVLHRKSFFDAHDIFPEPAKLARAVGNGGVLNGSSTANSSYSMYGEIEKRLRMRGIDEPAKDLDTLKQILEALQLKGLLHQTRRTAANNSVDAGRNIIYDTPNPPLILMKPVGGNTAAAGTRSSPSPSPRRREPVTPPSSRLGAASPRRNADPRPRRENRTTSEQRGMMMTAAERQRGQRSNGLRSDLTAADVRSPRSPATTARRHSPVESRRSSPAQSPRATTSSSGGGHRRVSPDVTGRSPRTRKPLTSDFAPAKDARLSDESSTVSESSYSTISQFDFEKVKMEEYREGRSLLDRCDKLLNSIAELTDISSGGCGGSSRSMEIHQPSPVSVLDASGAFYCDDTTSATTGSPPSPSPAASKRCLDFFKDASEAKPPVQRGQCWTPIELRPEDDCEAGDGDFLYVAEVLCSPAGPSGTPDDDVYYTLEKRRQVLQNPEWGKSASSIHRRLVFDTVVQIVDKKRHLSTWEAFTASQRSSPIAASSSLSLSTGREVWEEIKQIRECGDAAAAEDFFEAVCGVLEKDMAMDSREAGGWANRSLEMSDAVLDIERLIFKDLVAETIRDLAVATPAPSLSSSSSSSSSNTCLNSSATYNCRSSSSSSSAAALAAPRRKLVF